MGLGDNIIIRRVDARDFNSMFLEDNYRYVRLGNTDKYVKDFPSEFYDELIRHMAPGGVISYERLTNFDDHGSWPPSALALEERLAGKEGWSIVPDQGRGLDGEPVWAVLFKRIEDSAQLVKPQFSETELKTMLEGVAGHLQGQLKEMGYGDFEIDEHVDTDTANLPYSDGVNVGSFMSAVNGIDVVAYWAYQKAKQQENPRVNFILLHPFQPLGFGRDNSKILYTTSAVYINKAGKIAMAIFDQPVRIDAFVHESYRVTRGLEQLEAHGIPVLNTSAIIEIAKHKEMLNQILSSYGMDVPAELVITPNEMDPIKVLIDVSKFIDSHAPGEIVVKPASGAQGDGVRIFTQAQKQEIIDYVRELSKTDIVLVQNRIESEKWEGPQDHQLLDWNLRVLTTMDKEGKVYTNPDMIEVRFQLRDRNPVNKSKGAGVVTLREFFKVRGWGLEKQSEFLDGIQSVVSRATGILQNQVARKQGHSQGTGILGWDLIRGQDEKFYILEANTGPGGIGTIEKRLAPASKGKTILPIMEYLANVATIHFRNNQNVSMNDQMGETLDAPYGSQVSRAATLAFKSDIAEKILRFEVAQGEDLFFNLAVVLMRDGKYVEAEKVMRVGIKRFPNYNNYWDLAYVLCSQQRYVAALMVLREAISYKLIGSGIYALLICALIARERNVEADEVYNTESRMNNISQEEIRITLEQYRSYSPGLDQWLKSLENGDSVQLGQKPGDQAMRTRRTSRTAGEDELGAVVKTIKDELESHNGPINESIDPRDQKVYIIPKTLNNSKVLNNLKILVQIINTKLARHQVLLIDEGALSRFMDEMNKKGDPLVDNWRSDYIYNLLLLTVRSRAISDKYKVWNHWVELAREGTSQQAIGFKEKNDGFAVRPQGIPQLQTIDMGDGYTLELSKRRWSSKLLSFPLQVTCKIKVGSDQVGIIGLGWDEKTSSWWPIHPHGIQIDGSFRSKKGLYMAYPKLVDIFGVISGGITPDVTSPSALNMSEKMGAELEFAGYYYGADIHFKNDTGWVLVMRKQITGADEAMRAHKDEPIIKIDDPYTVKEGVDPNHFEVSVIGKKFEISRDDTDPFGKIKYYFIPPNTTKDECFIYTLPSGDAFGSDAIRGIRVSQDARRHGLARFMIRVLLDRYPNILYAHPGVRNAVLLKELIENFGFKPESPSIKPNAYYLGRDLTNEEIVALGNTWGTYKIGRRAFISSAKEVRKLLNGTPEEIQNQYVVADNLDVIAKDTHVTKLYLGKILYRNTSRLGVAQSKGIGGSSQLVGADFEQRSKYGKTATLQIYRPYSIIPEQEIQSPGSADLKEGEVMVFRGSDDALKKVRLTTTTTRCFIIDVRGTLSDGRKVVAIFHANTGQLKSAYDVYKRIFNQDVKRDSVKLIYSPYTFEKWPQVRDDFTQLKTDLQLKDGEVIQKDFDDQNPYAYIQSQLSEDSAMTKGGIDLTPAK